MNRPIHANLFLRSQRLSILGAVIGTACCLWGLFHSAEVGPFFNAYLFAWLFFLGISLGAMCLIMIHNLTGGPWGDDVRIFNRAASLNLPLLTVLFIPLLPGLHSLYSWARPENVAADATLAHRAVYLNVPFFIARSVVYLLLWNVLAWLLARWQQTWQRTQSTRSAHRLRTLSAGGLILYAMTMTHAGIDWIMSRDVHFNSTAFGLILTIGQTLSAFSLSIAFFCLPRMRLRMDSKAEDGAFIDMGNILLVLVILWTYVSFMQFLVIWMGNEREDNAWYVLRGLSQPGPWRWIGMGILLFHFFVPFFVLLFRRAKRSARPLGIVAWLLLIAHVVEVYWLVSPSGQETPELHFSILDVAAFLAVGGWWVWLFLRHVATAINGGRVSEMLFPPKGVAT